MLAAFFWHSRVKYANSFLLSALACTVAASIPTFIFNPSALLIFNIGIICILFARFRPLPPTTDSKKISRRDLWRYRITWAACGALLGTFLIARSVSNQPRIAAYLYVVSFICFLVVFILFSRSRKNVLFLFPATGAGIIVWLLFTQGATDHLKVVLRSIYVVTLLFFSYDTNHPHKNEGWWAVLINQPARILIFSFLLLSLTGTILLMLPFVTPGGQYILPIDAAFTSVSAVCVTGLTVLDTQVNFTRFGQGIILLLIQLGGLGIMSITAVAVQAMGHRISMKQERLLTEITDTDHADLLKSIITILKYTFVIEGAGTILLSFLFYTVGDTIPLSLWRGTFTAVSAFCNAGFSLQTSSLVPYREYPLILGTVSLLIIAGGMAPATLFAVPMVLKHRMRSSTVRIPLYTTAVLLVSGTVVFLTFEWWGMLDGLSFFNKIGNAWFQSVTLRTAGFNSLDIAAASGPTLLIMLILMFIGGSPGGTAGGVKTAVAGVLALTFWSTITNRKDILIGNKRIMTETVFRSVAIVISGGIIWLCTVVMLMATQQIAARDLIFEAMSALGTVGLTTGATVQLDEIGKIIIMIAMFAGRVGPMTLFMLLGNDKLYNGSRNPDARITLT